MAVTSNDAIEERRKEIQRRRKEQKLRRKKAAVRRLVIFVCILMVITLAILSLTVFFPVTKITVENSTIYSADQIIKASGAQKGKNLWMTGFNAEKDIPTKLPYVSEANVQRKFPSTVIITAIPAKAVYSVQNKNEYYLCDAEYKLLEIKKETDQNLISVIGIEPEKTKAGSKVTFKDEEKLKMLSTIIEGLKEKSITVDSLDLTELMEITVSVEGRFKVQFGSSAYLNMKIAHLAGMIKGTDKDAVGTIDLTDYTPENGKGILTRE